MMEIKERLENLIIENEELATVLINVLKKPFSLFKKTEKTPTQLMILNKEMADELMIIHQELAVQIEENELLVAESLIINEQNDKWTKETVAANNKISVLSAELLITYQNIENLTRELFIANTEKAHRAAELIIANIKKAKYAAELIIANKEKAKHATELIIANKVKTKRASELIIASMKKAKLARELTIANKEKAKFTNEFAIDKKERVVQNNVKENRTTELSATKEQASLKQTNLSPYIKSLITNQTAVVGQPFTFTIPDNIFIDNKSIVPLIYSAALTNGNPLPSWISFNPGTKTFSGTPAEAGVLYVKVVMVDKEKTTSYCPLKIMILNLISTKSEFFKIMKQINCCFKK